MLEKPMMKEMKQTMRMNTFFLFLSCIGYSSMRAVMKPSTVQNCGIGQSRGQPRLPVSVLISQHVASGAIKWPQRRRGLFLYCLENVKASGFALIPTFSF